MKKKILIGVGIATVVGAGVAFYMNYRKKKNEQLALENTSAKVDPYA